MNPNQSQPATAKQKLGILRIIHGALLAGLAIFALMVFALKKSTVILTDLTDPFLIVAPFMAIGGFIASNFLYKQQIAPAKNRDNLDSKLTVYQTALIIRCALLEGPGLFNIVCYFLTGNLVFLIIAGLIIVYFISIRPTVNTLENDLDLTYEEKLELS